MVCEVGDACHVRKEERERAQLDLGKGAELDTEDSGAIAPLCAYIRRQCMQ